VQSEGQKAEELNERVWKIIDECRDCVFITQSPGGFARARTMNKLQDKDRSGGIMWFVSEKKSKKAAEISANPKVTLFFSQPESLDYACVFGKAEIVEDPETKQRFWNDDWLKYWKNGPEDNNYVLIKVLPEKGEFFLNEEIQAGKIDYTRK
jgi:general stress protein 26